MDESPAEDMEELEEELARWEEESEEEKKQIK